MEAMHRAWPSLAGGNAATFDTLVQNGVKVLLSNRLPLVRHGFLQSGAARSFAEKVIAAFGVQCAGPDAPHRR